jgi:hypothetical protein
MAPDLLPGRVDPVRTGVDMISAVRLLTLAAIS